MGLKIEVTSCREFKIAALIGLCMWLFYLCMSLCFLIPAVVVVDMETTTPNLNTQKHECSSNGFKCVKCQPVWVPTPELSQVVHTAPIPDVVALFNAVHNPPPPKPAAAKRKKINDEDIFDDDGDDDVNDDDATDIPDAEVVCDPTTSTETAGGWVRVTIQMVGETPLFIKFKGSATYTPSIIRAITEDVCGEQVCALPLTLLHAEKDVTYNVRRIALTLCYENRKNPNDRLYVPARMTTLQLNCPCKVTGMTASSMDPPSDSSAETKAVDAAQVFALHVTDDDETVPEIHISDRELDALNQITITKDAHTRISIPRELRYRFDTGSRGNQDLDKRLIYCYVHLYLDNENLDVDAAKKENETSITTAIWRQWYEQYYENEKVYMVRLCVEADEEDPESQCRLRPMVAKIGLKFKALYMCCVASYWFDQPLAVDPKSCDYTRPDDLKVSIPLRIPMEWNNDWENELIIANGNWQSANDCSLKGLRQSFNSRLKLIHVPSQFETIKIATYAQKRNTPEHHMEFGMENKDGRTLVLHCPETFDRGNELEISKFSHVTLYVIYSVFEAPEIAWPPLTPHALIPNNNADLLLQLLRASCFYISIVPGGVPLPTLAFKPPCMAIQCGENEQTAAPLGYKTLNPRAYADEISLSFTIDLAADTCGTVAFDVDRTHYYAGTFALDTARSPGRMTVYPPSILANSRNQLFRAQSVACVVCYSCGYKLPVIAATLTSSTNYDVRYVKPCFDADAAMRDSEKHAIVFERKQPIRLRVYGARNMTEDDRVGVATVQRTSWRDYIAPRTIELPDMEPRAAFQVNVQVKYKAHVEQNTFHHTRAKVVTNFNVADNAIQTLSNELYETIGFDDDGPLLQRSGCWLTYELPVSSKDLRIQIGLTDENVDDYYIPYDIDGSTAVEWVGIINYFDPHTSDTEWVIVCAPNNNCFVNCNRFQCRESVARDSLRVCNYATHCATQLHGKLTLRIVDSKNLDDLLWVQATVNKNANDIVHVLMPYHYSAFNRRQKYNYSYNAETAIIMVRYAPSVDNSVASFASCIRGVGQWIQQTYDLCNFPATYTIFGATIEQDLLQFKRTGELLRGYIPTPYWLGVTVKYTNAERGPLWITIHQSLEDGSSRAIRLTETEAWEQCRTRATSLKGKTVGRVTIKNCKKNVADLGNMSCELEPAAGARRPFQTGPCKHKLDLFLPAQIMAFKLLFVAEELVVFLRFENILPPTQTSTVYRTEELKP